MREKYKKNILVFKKLNGQKYTWLKGLAPWRRHQAYHKQDVIACNDVPQTVFSLNWLKFYIKSKSTLYEYSKYISRYFTFVKYISGKANKWWVLTRRNLSWIVAKKITWICRPTLMLCLLKQGFHLFLYQGFICHIRAFL